MIGEGFSNQNREREKWNYIATFFLVESRQCLNGISRDGCRDDGGISG